MKSLSPFLLYVILTSNKRDFTRLRDIFQQATRRTMHCNRSRSNDVWNAYLYCTYCVQHFFCVFAGMSSDFWPLNRLKNAFLSCFLLALVLWVACSIRTLVHVYTDGKYLVWLLNKLDVCIELQVVRVIIVRLKHMHSRRSPMQSKTHGCFWGGTWNSNGECCSEVSL
jgi:hypothetical protein